MTRVLVVKKPEAKKPAMQGRGVVGTVVMWPIDGVKPNPWNPNRMTPFMRDALRQGFENDGWLASQALLVWATDEEGVAKNLIIDGEHRWTMAREMGIPDAPMVFLEGLTESKAKALTIKMNSKRGEFVVDKLGELLRSIEDDLDTPNLAKEFGIEDDDLMKLMATVSDIDPAAVVAATEPPSDATAPTERAPKSDPNELDDTDDEDGEAPPRMVQLFLDAANIDRFNKLVAKLGKAYGTETPTDTILTALEVAAKSKVAR